MTSLYLMLSMTYYAQNYAGIIGGSLTTVFTTSSEDPRSDPTVGGTLGVTTKWEIITAGGP